MATQQQAALPTSGNNNNNSGAQQQQVANAAVSASAAPNAPSQDATMDKYQIVGFIGNGSFGKVHKVIRKDDNRTLVWKEINYGQVRLSLFRKCFSSMFAIVNR